MVEVHEKLSSVHLTSHSSLGKILKTFLVDGLENEPHGGLEGNISDGHPSSTPEARCRWVILGPVHKPCGLGSPLIFRHDYDGQLELENELCGLYSTKPSLGSARV